MNKMPYKLVEFQNGLTLIMQTIPFANSVVVNIAVGAGSRYETKEHVGLAHFLEHMLFEGTKNFPTAKAVAERIEKIGGIGRAFTDKEYVSYYAKIQRQHLELAFEYLSDIFFNSLLIDDAIQKEKGIIIEELNQSKSNPEMDIWNLWFEWVWGKNQSLGRSIIGDKITIKSITRQKLQNYLNMFYCPSNMVIAVTGNFPTKNAEEFALKYFGKGQIRDIPTFKKIQFISKDVHVKIIKANAKQTQLILGFITDVSYHHKDRFSMQLISSILGEGVSSRLSNKLIYGLGIAYSVWTYTWIFTDNGSLCISGGFSPQNIEKAIKTALEELGKLKKQNVTERELKEVKEKYKARLYFSLETPDAMANLYSSQQIAERQIMTPEEIAKQIDKVTVEDIRRVAVKYFTTENLYLTIKGPLKKIEGKKIENLILDKLK